LGRVTGCVTTQRLVAPTSYVLPNQRYRIDFPVPPVALRAPSGGPRGLLFDVEIDVVIVEARADQGHLRWRVATQMYQYRLLDSDERELLVYHWQPGEAYRGPDDPHLHVSAPLVAQINALERRTIDLDKHHLATAKVSLAAFVRMLITEFQVAPRRPDWAESLARTDGILREAAEQGA
jgi:hypothetical protein